MRMSAGEQASGKDGVIYITGDAYEQFRCIEAFYERFGTSRKDILIILGDAVINLSGLNRNCVKKRFLESLSITLFYVYGNHDQRPQINCYWENRPLPWAYPIVLIK